MKAYTDLEQSKKLAEILPLESADMYYFTIIRDYPYSQGKIKTIAKIMDGSFSSNYDTPCWSLTALLEILNDAVIYKTDEYIALCYYFDNVQGFHKKLLCKGNSYVDACYEMIIKLHELNLL